MAFKIGDTVRRVASAGSNCGIEPLTPFKIKSMRSASDSGPQGAHGSFSWPRSARHQRELRIWRPRRRNLGRSVYFLAGGHKDYHGARSVRDQIMIRIEIIRTDLPHHLRRR